MFSKRKALSTIHLWNKAFLVKLASDLSSCGFTNIIVKLPHNLVGREKSEIALQELLDRERNYPSAILVATNEQTQEIIKILFVNISRKAFFLDDTFPSGHSEPPELFVQSPDPARAYSLFNFFYEYLQREKSSYTYWNLLLGLFSILFICAEFLSLIAGRRSMFQFIGKYGPLIDIVGSLIALALLYRYFTAPRGLFVKERKDVKVISYINMALKGELRDNPVVNILVSVITAIITALLLKWFGLL
jgi:hypothetical protein